MHTLWLLFHWFYTVWVSTGVCPLCGGEEVFRKTRLSKSQRFWPDPAHVLGPFIRSDWVESGEFVLKLGTLKLRQEDKKGKHNNNKKPQQNKKAWWSRSLSKSWTKTAWQSTGRRRQRGAVRFRQETNLIWKATCVELLYKATQALTGFLGYGTGSLCHSSTVFGAGSDISGCSVKNYNNISWPVGSLNSFHRSIRVRVHQIGPVKTSSVEVKVIQRRQDLASIIALQQPWLSVSYHASRMTYKSDISIPTVCWLVGVAREEFMPLWLFNLM